MMGQTGAAARANAKILQARVRTLTRSLIPFLASANLNTQPQKPFFIERNAGWATDLDELRLVIRSRLASPCNVQ